MSSSNGPKDQLRSLFLGKISLSLAITRTGRSLNKVRSKFRYLWQLVSDTNPPENDQWVEENWHFDDKELRDYLMNSQLGPFSSMCKLLHFSSNSQ